jgi:hypothetical protein
VAVICVDGTEILLTQQLPASQFLTTHALSETEVRAISKGSGWKFKIAGDHMCGPITGTSITGMPIGCSGSLACERPRPSGSSGDYFMLCVPYRVDSTGLSVDSSQGRAFHVDTMWQ